MPEVLEVEMYRRAALGIVGRRVIAIRDDDPIVVSPAGGLGMLRGTTVGGVHRHGKVLTIAFESSDAGEDAIDLHFGMTGRLIVDGRAGIDALVYGASDDQRWQRFALEFDRGSLVISDPRRFSRVRLGIDPALRRLGPDVLALTDGEFVRQVGAADRRAIKAALLDQQVLAGLGNMLVDEILFRVGADPRCRVADFGELGLRTVHRTMMEVLPELLERGGSHTGLLAVSLRRPGAPCPIDGAPLERIVVAGRTSFICPVHQRRGSIGR
ncbi:MAG: DNA-formamidopyrimidine glycosylase family protein [Ilumatobacteraceae bacterium]